MLSSDLPSLDVIEENPAWVELIDILRSANDTLILPQVEALMAVRKVADTEEYAVAEASLRMIGINLSSGIMRKQALRLAAAFDTINQYRQVMDTANWDKFAAFLIDDLFNVTRLWTSDYRSFYTVPQGRTLADGGKWYPTTHMELEVGASAEDAGFELTISHSLVPEIVDLLVSGNWMNEDEAREWATNHVGLQLNNETLHKSYVRAYLFGKRITEFFYQWAPIEDVLESIIITTQASAKLMYGARLIHEPFRYNSAGGKAVDLGASGFEHGTTVIRAGARFTFSYVTRYQDGSSSVQQAYCVSPEIEAADVGWCVFKVPEFKKAIRVELRYRDQSKFVELQLESNINVVDPVTLSIRAQNPSYGGRRVPFTAYAQYAGTSTVDITEESGFLKWETDFGVFEGATLVLPNVLADGIANVRCTYIGVDRELVATFQLKVLRNVAERYAVELEFITPLSVPQGQNFNVVTRAKFNDDTVEEVQAVLYSSTNKLDIQDNTVVTSVQSTDYLATLIAEYQTPGGPRLTKRNVVRVIARRWGVLATRIRVPDRIVERATFIPEAQLYIVDLDAPQSEIDAANPLYVRGWRAAHNSRWYGVSGSDYGALNPHPVTGEFIAPVVAEDTKYGIGFTAQYNGATVSGFKSVVVYDELLQLQTLDVLMNTFLPSQTQNTLRSIGEWNSGAQTELNAKYEVVFIPSESAVAQARADILAEIARRLAAGEDASDLDPDNPDYTQYVEIGFRDSAVEGYDSVKDEKFMRQLLVFSGTLHGRAKLTAAYEHNGKVLENVTTISLSPLRNRVVALHLEAPSVVGERSRTFVRAQVQYDTGDRAYIPAVWTADWYEQDQYTDLITFSAREWPFLELITVLENREPKDFDDFLSMTSSRLPVFAEARSMDDLKLMSAHGAIMQIDTVTELKLARLTARYYNVKAYLDITVTPAVPTPINTITNSYILGPTEVSADQLYASYALVNTYAMTGDLVLLDGTEIDGQPYEYEMEVSSDWVIMSNEEMQADGAYVPATSPLVSIDGDGYMRPLRNVDGRVMVRAVFNDNFNKFSRDLMVYIRRANTYLKSLDILGQSEVSDSPSGNPTVEYVDGLWYVPYNLRLVTADDAEGILIPATDALWSLVGPVSMSGVSLGESNGHLYVTKQQSDAQITISAKLQYPKPDGTMETIVGMMTIMVRASRSIISAYIDFTDSNIAPDTDIQMVMHWERRNQDKGNSLNPVIGINYQWALRTPIGEGITLSGDGVLRFRPSNVAQDAVVECTLTEDRTKIVEAIRVTCPGVGYPTSLGIEGFKRVRDDSSIQLKGIVKRAARPETDETANCFWTLRNANGDEVNYAGITINPRSGMLTSTQLAQDAKVYVHCLFLEGKIRLEATHVIDVISSIPYYGEAAFGVNTLVEVLALGRRLNAQGGGSFIIDARTDQYGYFCCREDAGAAELIPTALPNGVLNTGYEGWDGASWTLSDFSGRGPIYIEIVYENITERLALYRTNKRAAMLAKFTVKYLKP